MSEIIQVQGHEENRENELSTDEIELTTLDVSQNGSIPSSAQESYRYLDTIYTSVLQG